MTRSTRITSRSLRICDKGHRYYKTSDCPTCQTCQSADAPPDGFLALLSRPARSALEHEGITTLEKLATYSRKEILGLHGVGQASIPTLTTALEVAGLSFRQSP